MPVRFWTVFFTYSLCYLPSFDTWEGGLSDADAGD